MFFRQDNAHAQKTISYGPKKPGTRTSCLQFSRMRHSRRCSPPARNRRSHEAFQTRNGIFIYAFSEEFQAVCALSENRLSQHVFQHGFSQTQRLSVQVLANATSGSSHPEFRQVTSWCWSFQHGMLDRKV